MRVFTHVTISREEYDKFIKGYIVFALIVSLAAGVVLFFWR